MTNIVVTDLAPSDYAEFHAGIAEEDHRELTAAGSTPWRAFEDAMYAQRCGGQSLALRVNGELTAIGGITPVSGNGIHMLWLLCTDKIRKYPKDSYKVFKLWIDSANREGLPCWNVTSVHSTGHHRLLKRLGLNIDTTETHDVSGNPFYIFTNW